jgi:hypothetical protein
MLTIVLNDGFEIPWHTGEKIPEIWQAKDPQKPRRFPTDIIADGDELAFILTHFQNLPVFQPGRVQQWSGDFAKFIYNNLACYSQVYTIPKPEVQRTQ